MDILDNIFKTSLVAVPAFSLVDPVITSGPTIGKIKIYDAADTGLFYDMKLIGEEGIDVALLPIGDNFTMGPDDALRAAKLIKPKVLIPMHYNTFELIKQDSKSFAARMKKALPKTKVVILKPGKTFTV